MAVKYPAFCSIFCTVGWEPSNRLKTGTPFTWLYLPVRIEARLGVQIAFVANTRSILMPSCASLSRFGVRLTRLP